MDGGIEQFPGGVIEGKLPDRRFREQAFGDEVPQHAGERTGVGRYSRRQFIDLRNAGIKLLGDT
jgi:hypothetical protein